MSEAEGTRRKAVNLHYGCGLSEASGWYNCDGSQTLWLQRLPIVGSIFCAYLPPRFPSGVHYGDIVCGLSIPSSSCDAIYCCHVLEHLSLDDLRLALRNTYEYLAVGGLFRLVVPDFEQQVAAYLADAKATAVSDFLTYTFLGRKVRPKGIVNFIREYFGGGNHLWMWDYKGLAHELERAGFLSIRRCQSGDAANPIFVNVEDPARFEWALAIECTK